jgi:excisionase family DNA binding protein
MPTFEPLLVDTRTACQMLGIKRTLLFRYLAEGSLRRCKIGRKTVVPMSDIKSFVAARIA